MLLSKLENLSYKVLISHQQSVIFGINQAVWCYRSGCIFGGNVAEVCDLKLFFKVNYEKCIQQGL